MKQLYYFYLIFSEQALQKHPGVGSMVIDHRFLFKLNKIVYNNINDNNNNHYYGYDINYWHAVTVVEVVVVVVVVVVSSSSSSSSS